MVLTNATMDFAYLKPAEYFTVFVELSEMLSYDNNL